MNGLDVCQHWVVVGGVVRTREHLKSCTKIQRCGSVDDSQQRLRRRRPWLILRGAKKMLDVHF